MKKSPQIIAAEKAVEEAEQSVASLELQLKSARERRDEAYKALLSARMAADAELPQVTVTLRSRRTGTLVSSVPSVIIRKTPSGMLIVRGIGEPNERAHKYKLQEYSGRFVRVRAAQDKWAYNIYWLEDVPSEFLPQ